MERSAVEFAEHRSQVAAAVGDGHGDRQERVHVLADLGHYDPALWIPYTALAAQILVATLVTIVALRWQERAPLGHNRTVR